MLADERKNKILELLDGRPAVTTSELTALFQVSLETIRRDLEYLEKEGALKRVHGGAVAARKLQSYASLSRRAKEHRPEKRDLAQAACSFIREGDYIALDAGSTTFELALLLRDRFRELTVLTHSLELVRILAEREGIRTILAGGFYTPAEKCFCGHLTLDMIRQLHVNKCFIAPAAISLDFGISDHMPEMIAVQRSFSDISDETYVLVDSSKFETCAPLKICGLNPHFRYITDAGLSDEIWGLYQDTSINIIRPERSEGGRKGKKLPC